MCIYNNKSNNTSNNNKDNYDNNNSSDYISSELILLILDNCLKYFQSKVFLFLKLVLKINKSIFDWIKNYYYYQNIFLNNFWKDSYIKITIKVRLDLHVW